MNCHGCKWLDEVKSQPKGSGYCCKVERSNTQKEKARFSHMERCELYEQGDFATRYAALRKEASGNENNRRF